MTPTAICTCAGQINPRCAVHGSQAADDFANGDVTPLQPSVSFVLEATESSLLQLLNEHRRWCQLCWMTLEQHRSCAAGVLLRQAWFHAFELLLQPSRWSTVEVLAPLGSASTGAPL